MLAQPLPAFSDACILIICRRQSFTVLGSRSQRGLTQLALDVLFRAIEKNVADIETSDVVETTLKAADTSEAVILPAPDFIASVYGESPGRMPPPQSVRDPTIFAQLFSVSTSLFPSGFEDELERVFPETLRSSRIVHQEDDSFSLPTTCDDAGLDGPASFLGNVPFTGGGRRQPLQVKDGNGNAPSRPFPTRRYMCATASVRQKKMCTKTYTKGGDPAGSTTPRRHFPRPPAAPQVPNVSNANVSADPVAEYAVLISMYEVHNDRIFDLLASPIKSTVTKECRRRPLPFKATESSPERKVVAGLRKIICTSMAQALMVLEAGLQERRVTGTGSNSASSRSHGFFCIEVKKRKRSISKRHQYPWSGSTLTLADLAGSERARDAKTAGATLAEAGKINESLMYLGQCLQMQSDSGSSNKASRLILRLLYGAKLTYSQAVVVPFRQCKLTELLFSNSFPSPSALSQSQSIRRNPQKALMIVAADAHGDYNATSQILRYSALAKEVTVPRVPSITETILQANATATYAPSDSSSCSGASLPASPIVERQHPPVWPTRNGGLSPSLPRVFSPAHSISAEGRITMEHAALEIARLSEETSRLQKRLALEQEARAVAESHLMSMEDRVLELEQAIREECATEFEQRLAVELARWKTGMQMAIERGEEHWDRKMEVFERSLALQNAASKAHKEPAPAATHDDGGAEEEDKENMLVESLEEENARLRREMAVLKRELSTRTPSKRFPLMQRDDFLTSDSTGSPRSSRSRHASRNLAPEASISGDVLQRRMESLTLRSGEQHQSSNRNHHHATIQQSSASLENIRAAENLRVAATHKSRADGSGSPLKKVRYLGDRRWELEGGWNLEDPF